MGKKNIIKMILMQFGYDNIVIDTFWTGTGDGAYPNRFGYEVWAEKKDRVVDISGNDFQEAIHALFEDITREGIDSRDVIFIDEAVFLNLK